ncbi:hypothetical protein ENUP19_0083G0064 [Entamoeba nuttalli]|uniref:Uncharacterized protein n=2 Tax=Entamoeba nuttalli TaxID=412467 RepID=K2H4H1_ENTNP|nr:hypothetical protein ENU1_199690 [Entamoeba nuttalli P19]EKE37379.1 hypothetical protein ENU1_199690 [Entamoeba nuttalli P19]|eukprot:XP_008860289.1 hypothetical protein ENU1_199690 [Entamoeba nuttalli P19]
MTASDTSDTSFIDNGIIGIPSVSHTPYIDSSEQSIVETNGFFVGMYIVEFDTISGEQVVYKQVTHPLNMNVENELIGMMMGVDYYEYSNITILLHTITNYHVMSVHFTCFNPSNKRGYVTTCCIAVMQSSPFTTSQIDLLSDKLTQLAIKFQSISQKHKSLEHKEYIDVMSLQELIDSTDPVPFLFHRIVTSYSLILLSTHNHYSLCSDYSNPIHPGNIIACGGHSLFNWSFSPPSTFISNVSSHPSQSFSSTNETSINALHSITSNQPQFSNLNNTVLLSSSLNKEHWTLSEEYSINSPFPPCSFPTISSDSNKFGYDSFISEFSSCYPNILFSLLSGLQCLVYTTQPCEPSRIVDIAKFLASFNLSGVSSEIYPPLEIIDNKESFIPSLHPFTQIFVIVDPIQGFIPSLYSTCSIDISKEFYGLIYSDEMKSCLLDSFVKYAKEKKLLLAQKMWNVLLDYSQLTMKSFIDIELFKKIQSSPERFIVSHFQRVIEKEKVFIETGKIIINRPVLAHNMFTTIQLK